MAGDPILLPVAVEADDLFATYVAALQEQWPGWDPADASLATWVGQGLARIFAQVAETAQAVATDIYIDSGTRLDNILPISPVAATGVGTITVQDTNGYTIPDGTVFGIDIGSDQTQNFQLVDPASVPNGSSSLAGVSVTAVEAGEASNDLSGVAVIVDAPSYVTGFTFTATTGGGLEGETVDAYVGRLTIARRLRAPRPINARDFADFSREMVAGVARCGVLDGYNPGTGFTGGYLESNMATWTKLAVTLVPLRDDGEPADSAPRTAVDVLYNGDTATNTPGIREWNWNVYVRNPHYTTVSLAVSGTTWDSWSPVDVAAAVVVALQEFLSPANWGQPSSGEERRWENNAVLHASDLYAVIRSVEGVRAVTGLALSSLVASNPGFETNTTGWSTTTPAGWLNSGGVLTRVTSGMHSGVGAGQVVGNGAATNEGAALPLSPAGGFRAGYLYAADIWVKGNAGGEVLDAFLGVSAAGDHTTVAITATTGWVRTRITWVPATDVATAYVGTRKAAAAAATWFMDDIELLTPLDFALPVTDSEPMPLPRAGNIVAALT